MSDNLKNLILDTAKDMALEFMERRGDEELSEEDLEKAIKDEVVTVEEIANTFKEGISERS